MRDLESNGDVFGNSPGIFLNFIKFHPILRKGVGKWDDEWKNSQINSKK